MKEITRIITVQITDIAKVEDDFDFEESKEKTFKTSGQIIKNLLGGDDAVVVKVQDFIRDVAEEEGADNGQAENAE